MPLLPQTLYIYALVDDVKEIPTGTPSARPDRAAIAYSPMSTPYTRVSGRNAAQANQK